MNFVQRVLLGIARRAVHVAGLPLRDPSVSTLFGYMDTTSGVSVTEWTAMTFSAVWASIRLLSEGVGTLPCCLFERIPSGGRREADWHDAYPLVTFEPNNEQSHLLYFETQTSHTLSWGNSYSEIQIKANGRPYALWTMPPNRVTVDRDKRNRIIYRLRRSSGGEWKFPAERVLHVPGLSYDGIMGYSPITMARESIALGIAAERFGAAFYGNNAMPGGVLTTPETLKPEARANLRDSFQLIHQGVDRSHRIALLEAGVEYKPIMIQPDNAQFLQTRQFQIEEIARWFNIPPHMLKDLSRSTNNNIEQQSLEFVIYSLRPWLIRWEEELNRKLIRREERARLYFKFNVNALLRGDIKTRYDAYATARREGWMSADDILEKEDENPLPDGMGKIITIPANTMPLNGPNAYKPGPKMDSNVAKAVPPAPATNPTDPVMYLRSQKPQRTMKQAIRVLDGLPGKKDVKVFMPVNEDVEKPKASDFKDAKKRRLHMRSLVATRASVDRGKLKEHLQDPDKEGDKGTMGDMPTDRPYVFKRKGVYYLFDGHHRIMADILSDVGRPKVYLLKV